jgi:hypothetical protein
MKRMRFAALNKPATDKEMAQIHMTEAEVTGNFAAALEKVSGHRGAEAGGAAPP